MSRQAQYRLKVVQQSGACSPHTRGRTFTQTPRQERSECGSARNLAEDSELLTGRGHEAEGFGYER